MEWILEGVGWEELETMNVENYFEFYSKRGRKSGAVIGGGYKVSNEDFFSLLVEMMAMLI